MDIHWMALLVYSCEMLLFVKRGKLEENPQSKDENRP